MNVTLRVSQGISFERVLSAEAVVQQLCEMNMQGTVTASVSSVDDDLYQCYAEAGVILDLYKSSKQEVTERLWPQLRDIFSLECAHITAPDFRGCVYDWMRESQCPASRRRARAQL